MKRSIILIISIILLLLSCGVFAYLYYQNEILNKDVINSQENIKKVQEKISNNEKEITEKESEYEKLKETVKENLEELSIWEETKEKLEKSLS